MLALRFWEKLYSHYYTYHHTPLYLKMLYFACNLPRERPLITPLRRLCNRLSRTIAAAITAAAGDFGIIAAARIYI